MVTKLTVTTKGLMVSDEDGRIIFFADLNEDQKEAFNENFKSPAFWATFTGAFVTSLVDEDEAVDAA